MNRLTGRLWLLLLAPALRVVPVCAQRPATALSLDSAVAEALRASPSGRQAAELTREQRALRRTAFSPQNPAIWTESPTADFYAIGVQQTLDFPTVYTRQSKLIQAQVALAEQGQRATAAAIRRDARLAYLDLQVAEARLRQLQQQDSLTRSLAAASARLYKVGEVDYLQRVGTEAEARQVANRVQQARADQQAAQRRLALLLNRPAGSLLMTGTDLTQPAAVLLADTLRLAELEGSRSDSAALAQNPDLAYAARNVTVSALARRLTRARALPGVAVGYLNQGARDSPLSTRWQAGIMLPLYFWTYNAQNRAADARLRAAEAGRAATELDTRRQLTQAQADVRKYAASLRYFAATGLPQAATIASTARRLFAAGEVNYYLLVQSLRDAAAIRAEYLDAVAGYRQALIQTDYLLGQ